MYYLFSKMYVLRLEHGLRSFFLLSPQMVIPMIKRQFDVCLRNDFKIDERQRVRGWKNLRLNRTGLV